MGIKGVGMAKLETFPADLEFDESGKRLYFEGVELTPDIRTLMQMMSVVFDKGFYANADKNREQYYMFRGIARKLDKPLFEQHGIRYDITVIPAWDLGKEYNKTIGHYHPKSEVGTRYPEIYEVLEGQAHYLFQKLASEKGDVDDVLFVSAKKGDKIVVPSGYGHVTINPTRATLVMANLTALFKSEYELYRIKEGAAYFELIDDSLTPNRNYENLPLLKRINAREFHLNQEFEGDNVYQQFLENPHKFDFLKK